MYLSFYTTQTHTLHKTGFNVETLQFKSTTLTIWDVGGQDRIRPLWRHYFNNTQGIIYVVDSNDRDRIGIAREELSRMLHEDELNDAVLLVLANKQDLPKAMGVGEIVKELGLTEYPNRVWHVQPSTATTGEGLHEGLSWLDQALKQKQ